MRAQAAVAPAGRSVVPLEIVERRIYLIRGRKVMLDADLAKLYGVATKRLNEQVRRNITRFPSDFMFQLYPEEAELLRSQFATSIGEADTLRSQFVTSNTSRGGRRYLPLAFTEQGVAMLSSVLSSERAVQVNIAIMRTFVKLRQVLSHHKELAARLRAMEEKYDAQFKAVFEAINELMDGAPVPPKRRIGFSA